MVEINNLSWEDFEEKLNKFSLENKENIETEYKNKILLLKLIEYFSYQSKNNFDECEKLKTVFKQNNKKEIDETIKDRLEYYDSKDLNEFLKYKEFGKNYWIIED